MRFLLLFLLLTFAKGTLTTTFESGDQTVTGSARLPSLFVEPDTPPTPGLAPGAFTAIYTGTLILEKRSRLTFSFEGKGNATLHLNNEEILTVAENLSTTESKRLRLNPGDHTLKITYQSPDDGAGSFRLFWAERRAFPKEPMPSTVFKESDAPVDPASLFSAHRCIKCHTTNDLGPHALPELSHPGPDLTHIGARVTEAWLARWIAEPDKLKPTTTMPAMVDHTKPEGAQAAADLAAYLATLKKEEASEAPHAALAQDGGAHFHKLGCVACHSLPANNEPDFDNNRIPLNNVAAKFRGDSLTHFLKNPQEHYDAIKMPNFRLKDKEASSLAAFLISESTGRHTPDPSEFPPGDAWRGATLAKSLNCAACHQGMPTSEKKAPQLTDLNFDSGKGCLGPEEKQETAPRLILTKEEKQALIASHPSLKKRIKFDTPAAYTTRQIKALRCISCHEHDGKSSLLTANHGDTNKFVAHIDGHAEKLEQSRPPLTHIGAMLHTPFLKSILEGSREKRPRPWLDMRMPGFPLQAEKMAKGFAHQHGLPTSPPSAEEPPAGHVEIGKGLTGMTGYACVTCHGVGEAPALAAFEVQGINFAQAHERLREDYFLQWMHNPTRIVPDTKMPKYTNDDGTALRPNILEGDAQKQFSAIRAYLQSISR